MQNLGVTMSYTVVQGVLKKLGENYDSKVREWCEKMRVAKLNNVSYIATPYKALQLLNTMFIRSHQVQPTHIYKQYPPMMLA